MVIFTLPGGRGWLATLPGHRVRRPQRSRARSRQVRVFAARIGSGLRQRTERTLKTVKHIVAYARAASPMQHAAAADTPAIPAELAMVLEATAACSPARSCVPAPGFNTVCHGGWFHREWPATDSPRGKRSRPWAATVRSQPNGADAPRRSPDSHDPIGRRSRRHRTPRASSRRNVLHPAQHLRPLLANRSHPV